MPKKTTPKTEMVRKEVKMPPAFIECRAMPETFNDEERTVEVQYATETQVQRYDWHEGFYWEVLSTEKGHVRLDKLNNGAPLLDSHDRWSVGSVLGVIESADEQTAIIRFANDEKSEEAFQKVKDGIITKVSVGYRIHELEKDGEKDGNPIFRAIDWEPYEISLVAIPADDQAEIRSDNKQVKNTCVVLIPEAASRGEFSNERKENTMPDKVTQETETRAKGNDNPQAPAQPAGLTHEEATRAADRAAENERERCTEIHTISVRHNLGDDFVKTMIAENKSVEDVRAAALDALEQRSQGYKANNHVKVGEDNTRKFRMEGAENALRCRSMGGRVQLTEIGRQYMGLGLLDLARECVNERIHDKMELVQRAMNTTSDFSLILENVMHKNIRDMFEDTSRTFTMFSYKTNFSDFKPKNSYTIARGFDLEKVNEHGEYRYGQLEESKEITSIDTYGIKLGITRKAIVNDDMDVFTRLPRILVNAAAAKESDIVYSLLLNNPKLLEDGKVVFHADHNNKGTAQLSVKGLDAGRVAMRTQKGLGGKAHLNIAPKYLVVPAALETEAYKITAPIAPTQAENVNPYAPGGKTSLETVVESRLDAANAKGWYLFGVPNVADMIEYGYLDGNEGPVLERNEKMDIDGVGFTLRHDFGAGLKDFRGGYYSDGQAA